MAQKKSSTPAQARRNSLAEVIRERGESPYNIWVARPPFDDDDVLLTSDSAFELFYYLEGDARFIQISYAPLQQIDGKRLANSDSALAFARVVDAEGQTREVFMSRMGKSGNGTVTTEETSAMVIGIPELDAYRQRIENWRRIVPCIRRVRRHPIATVERQLLLALRDGEQRSIRYLRNVLTPCPAALVVGAIATLLRRRELRSDCDSRPWSLNTLLRSAP